MSDLATRTSTVSGLTAATGLTSGAFERPASKAATPPAPRAMSRTTRRAAFIRCNSQAHRAAGRPRHHTNGAAPLARISAGNGQGMVKQRYPNRVNDELLPELVAQIWIADIQPVSG